MITVNYITRPYFIDISLELINDLKKKCNLNVVIILSDWSITYLEIEDVVRSNKGFQLNDIIKNHLLIKYKNYIDGANVIFFQENSKETSLINIFKWRQLLKNNCKLLNADLFILETLSFADMYFLMKIRKQKIYHILHDPVLHLGENRRKLNLIRKYFFKYIDKFILYSNWATNLFKKNFPIYAKRTITLQTPIYGNRFKTNILKTSPKVPKCILFFGRISPYKGVDIFFNAAEELSKQFTDVKFIIAGKCINNYSPNFLTNNTNSNIQIINEYISSSKLSELMTNSLFCVLPYLDASQSGVIMTSYAYNLPVLVSDCPGLMEYCFDHNNFSFRNKDTKDLINKMRHLLTNQYILDDYKLKIDYYNLQYVSLKNVDKILKTIKQMDM